LIIVSGVSGHISGLKSAISGTLPAIASPDARALIVDMRDLGLKYEADDVLNTGVYDGSNHYVLKDVNLQLEEGSFHFLTGPSGTGKTSLMRLLYLSLKQTEGALLLFGEEVNHKNRDQVTALRRKMGIVFQDFRLLDHLNVFDNAALPLFFQGQKKQQYEEDVLELLNWVGLKSKLKAMPHTLSGGEKQRLAIARSVVTRPALIIADEPTGNVDHAMGLKIMRLFVELNRLGSTLIIATHDEAMIKASAKPVLEIHNGQIVRREPRGGRDKSTKKALEDTSQPSNVMDNGGEG
jgi:cell division transport system ATP-binding protein